MGDWEGKRALSLFYLCIVSQWKTTVAASGMPHNAQTKRVACQNLPSLA